MPAPSRPPPDSAPPSLAEDIRRRTDLELRELLQRRPDLARPAPTDLTTLAARATTRASVQRALDSLDRGHLQVLEALLVTGEPDREATAGLIGVSRSRLQPFLDDLWRVALLWHSPEGLRVVRTASELLGPYPAGLAPALVGRHGAAPPTRPTSDELDVAIAHASSDGRAILDRLTWGPPLGVLAETGPLARAGAELAAAGLLTAVSDTHVLLPRDVAMRLRDGLLHREPSLAPPAATTTRKPPDSVDDAAGGQASDLLGRLDELAEEWGARPPRVLRSGGLAVRDLKRTTAALDLPPERAAFVVELAHAAGLVADDGSLEPVWAPTPAYDDWQQQPAAQRWVRLATAWWATSRAPSLVGSTVPGAGTVNALSGDGLWPPGRQRRHDVLAELAALPEGSAPDLTSIEARVRWRRPLRLIAEVGTKVDVVLREAEWAGVTGRGALGSAGRLLLSGDVDGAAAAMAEHLPAAMEYILLQADLTAIAPGRLDGSLAQFMRLAANVESRGGATVFRFSSASIRRILDAGWSAAQIRQALEDASRTPVPQPLDYLVNDVARRHGQTRVGSVGAYVRSDDGAVLDRMEADRGLGPLQLRRIAPTVLVTPTPATTLLDLLRDNGFTPVAETSDGGVLMTPVGAHRTPARRAEAPLQALVIDDAAPEQLVSALRAGEAAAAYRKDQEDHQAGPRLPACDPTVTLALLREAAADGLGVWIGYVDSTGGSRRVLLRPNRVEGGRAFGVVADSDVERSFSVHRITGAAPA